MREGNERLLDVLVVGAGPTGIAALVEASLLGLRAAAIEAGAVPAASLFSHLENLAYLSPAEHFEVGGFPVDCREAGVVTREDVLQYYARVVGMFALDIRCGMTCGGFDIDGDTVLVSVAGHAPIRARHVLVTAWYEPRQMAAAVEEGSRVRILHWLGHPLQVAAEDVVVWGGGISGVEYASALMMAGKSVPLLMRGAPSRHHERPWFRDLCEATGSAVISRVESLSVGHDSVTVNGPWGARKLRCTTIVAALGRVLSEDMLFALKRAGVFDEDVIRRLRAARSFEQVMRDSPELSPSQADEIQQQEAPDLWDAAFCGKIRVAGAITHGGAANAGVRLSTLGAVYAMRALAGQAPLAERPLGRALLREWQEVDAQRRPPPHGPEQASRIRPMSLAAIGARTPRLGGVEDDLGFRAAQAPSQAACPPELAADLLRVADGVTSIEQLARTSGMVDAAPLLEVYRRLLKSGLATWLPWCRPSHEDTT